MTQIGIEKEREDMCMCVLCIRIIRKKKPPNKQSSTITMEMSKMRLQFAKYHYLVYGLRQRSNRWYDIIKHYIYYRIFIAIEITKTLLCVMIMDDT